MGPKPWDDLIIVTTNDIPGKKIAKTIGMVEIRGHMVRGKTHAHNKLRKVAYKKGANAVIGVQSNQVGENRIFTGTAVIIEDAD
jgi:uncharacterized protein YbjQ (UPF0145 family)